MLKASRTQVNNVVYLEIMTQDKKTHAKKFLRNKSLPPLKVNLKIHNMPISEIVP